MRVRAGKTAEQDQGGEVFSCLPDQTNFIHVQRWSIVGRSLARHALKVASL